MSLFSEKNAFINEKTFLTLINNKTVFFDQSKNLKLAA